MSKFVIPKLDQRTIVLIGLLAMGLIVTAMWSYGRLNESRSAATAAAADLATCGQLAAGINQLGRQPARAGSHEMQLNELTRRIERSAKSAQIPPDSLIRISPDPTSRIGDTSYQKKSTQVLFRQVTLRQIITFLHTVAAQDAGPQTTRIRLVTPRDQKTGDRWTAETTLTYLIYDPRIKAADRR